MKPMVMIFVALALTGCGGSGSETPSANGTVSGSAPAGSVTSPATPVGPPISKTTESGPVRAKVSLSPAKPSLGDPLTLVLEVTAEPGVEVHMPAFGEALGRFEVLDWRPHDGRTPGGGTESSQRYTLAAPLSGRQTIPPLLVEFNDRRPGQDATDKELLTEELSVEVASVLPEGQSATLRPARGALSEAWPPTSPQERGLSLLAVLVVAVAISLAVAFRRGRRALRRRSAFDVALARLDALTTRGAPRAGDADAWYVELSSIIRTYIEDRFAVRAPELTTEEFIREAGAAPELTSAHKALLGQFLERCDRVKFAGYRPDEQESRDALTAARRFLDETRLTAHNPPATEAARAPAA